MEESTTFDEAFIENDARFPSFTLCPYDSYINKSIKSFEDVAEAVNNAKLNFKINYVRFTPHEEIKGENVTYNQTLNNDWYFAPATTAYPPYNTIICLIIAPYREHKHNPDRSYTVS